MTHSRTASLQPLPRAFYDRDPRQVARDLLGKILVRRQKNGVLGGRIVETEAYLGENDAAAHSAAGRTARNQVLFGPPGHAYVYFIYGNHYCLNVSCLPEGNAGCVLIRALEPLYGIPRMARNRGIEEVPQRNSARRLLTSGPGRLCEALAITRVRDNGKDFTGSTDLAIADDGFRQEKVARTARVGITKAADEKLRFVIVGSPFVSGKRT
jgi:DNA-3-methyladenine glycosylase